MRVGSDAHATVAALQAQPVAFVDTLGIFEGFDRLFEASLVVAAVVNNSGAAIGLVRKVRLLDEIPPPYLHLVQVQVSRDRVGGALGDIPAFRSPVAAI